MTVSVGLSPPPPPPEVKDAVTAAAELIVSVQVFPVAAEQSPPQPAKAAPASEAAVSVTDVPSA